MTWVLRLSLGGGQREMGLGRLPSLTLAQAREQACARRAKVSLGNDPIATRRATRSVVTPQRSAQSLERMGDEAALASVQAGKTVATVGADLQRLGAQTLPEVQRLLVELNVLAESMRRLSEQTERNPAGLLLGRSPVPPGPGESGAAVRSP